MKKVLHRFQIEPTEKELRDIRLFLKKADELHNIRAKTNIKISANIKYEDGSPVKLSATLPDENDLRSYLMAFRFFFLKKESTYFPKILNIIKRRTADTFVREYLDTINSIWSGAWAKKQFIFKVNDEEITPELVMDLWFNAHYFHADEVKNSKLSKVNIILSQDFCKALLVDAVINASRAVFQLAYTLRALK